MAKMLVDQLVAALKARGLRLNPTKCATLHIKIERKRKTYYVDRKTVASVDGLDIPTLGPKDSYKYLGVEFNIMSILTDNNQSGLREKLLRLEKAELRPNQKLFVLRNQLIPAQYHWATFSDLPLSTLRSLDILIRDTTRKILHLPKDTPKAAFHAPVSAGGLGLACIETRTRRLRRARLLKLHQSDDPVITGTMLSAYNKKRIEQLTTPQELGLQTIVDEETEKAAWTNLLHSSADGIGLVQFAANKPLNGWLTNPEIRITGGDFIKCVHMRLATVKTPSRAARGRRENNNLCKFDKQLGSLAHISQVCAVTHAKRVNRHNRLVDMICKSIKKNNPSYRIIKEPRIPKGGTFCKPDIVIVTNSDNLDGKVKANILDPQITSDQTDMNRRHHEKCSIYDGTHTTSWLQEQFKTPESEIDVAGIILNFRGGFLASSQKTLRKKLKISRKFMEYLVVGVLVNTWHLWKFYKNTS